MSPAPFTITKETTMPYQPGDTVHDRQGTPLRVKEVRDDGRLLVEPATPPPPGLGGPCERVVKVGELLVPQATHEDGSGEPDDLPEATETAPLADIVIDAPDDGPADDDEINGEEE